MLKIKKVVIFDFDHTLYLGESGFDFLLFYFGYTKLLLNLHHLIAYKLRSNNELSFAKLMKKLFSQVPVTEITSASEIFVAKYLDRKINPLTFELFKKHHNQGDTCILASRSFLFYLQPWAKKVGFHHVAATQLDVLDNVFTGKFLNHSCTGNYKVNAVKEFISQYPKYSTVVYTDGSGDIPLLEFGDSSYLVSGRSLSPYEKS